MQPPPHPSEKKQAAPPQVQPAPAVAPSEKKEAAPPQVQPAPAVAIDFEAELKKLEALIQQNDKNASAYFNRAWLYEHKGDTQSAIKDYSKAIELDKGMKDAFYNRGLIFTRMKKFDEAIRDFSEVMKLQPSASDAYCNRGNIHFHMRKLDLALDDYNAGLKTNPEDGDLLYNRALVYLARGEKAAAAEDLKSSAQRFHDKTRKEFPELAPPPPPLLKKAAMEGRVVEFSSYMSDNLRQRVQGFDQASIKVEKAVLELEKKAKQFLGDKFRRQGNTLSFSIAGTDPRWAEVFGPKWPEMMKQNPNGPRFFHMPFEFDWKEEIPVIRQLQACLENPSFCQEAAPRGSALHLKKVGGAWTLVDGKTPEEWERVQAMGEGIARIVQVVDEIIAQNKGTMSDEEMVLFLATTYKRKMNALSRKVQATGVNG
jgi:tetratricopeptide (TPR) repeat protein